MLEWLREIFAPLIRIDTPAQTRYLAVDPSINDIKLRALAHVYSVTASNVGLAVTTEHVIAQKSIIWGISSVQATGASTGCNWYVDMSNDANYTDAFQLFPNLHGGSMTGYIGQCLTPNIFPLVVNGGTRIRMRSAVAAGVYTFKNSLLITEL